jgi:hypothetical protein
VVDLPPGAKARRCKWVWTAKYDENGKLDRYKARLVFLGCFQEEGKDYEETWAPVCRFESLRILMAIATILDLHTLQIDVRTAFLNGTLEEHLDIYMKQPERFEIRGKESTQVKKSHLWFKANPKKMVLYST